MAAKSGNGSPRRLGAGLTALMLGTGMIACSGAALAQQDEHRGRDNGQPQQQAPARPAPPPRAAPAQAMERGGNWRTPGQWNGQPRSAPGNGTGNGWQSRQQQPAYAGHAQPQYRGQQAYHGQPADQGQPGTHGDPWRGDGGQRRGDNGQWRGDGGQWRGDDGHPRGNDRQWRGNGGPWRGNDGQRGGDGGQWRGGYGQGDYNQRGGQWNHGWRQDNRYDWRGYREENRDAFHVGRYYAPYREYSYNRVGVGFYLQPLFFGSGYWIGDPWYYRLPPAYGPYHWVRYYNDVLLVNTYTGQVADVIYDFFW